MAEQHITRVAAKHPEQLGYPGALTVSGFVWGDAGGVADLVIFPTKGRVRLAIVEVKRAKRDAFGGRNPQAHADVVGQLLKYYARALTLDIREVKAVVKYLEGRGKSHHRRLSLRRVANTSAIGAAPRTGRAGRTLKPEEVRLHILVNRPTTALRRRLPRICRVLKRHHRLPIRVWYVASRPREIRRLC